MGAGLLNALDSDFGVVISSLERPVDPPQRISQLMCLPCGVMIHAMAKADLHSFKTLNNAGMTSRQGTLKKVFRWKALKLKNKNLKNPV